MFCTLLASISLLASSSSLPTLYSSLDPLSLSEQLAFYELYPETEEGGKALAQAWSLLRVGEKAESAALPTLSQLSVDLQAVVALVTREPTAPPVKLEEDQLALIERLSSHFPNRKLKGSSVWTREEVLALDDREVDLGRGLLIEQFDGAENFRKEIRQYEASLDLMALQVMARLPANASNVVKIREINRFIFQEMQFRFPPHSLYAKDIDLYTFLPSVLDSRQGVCLGVSILYLCIAQRLDLPLEIITPPGHIYVRYHEGDRIINIETTARGINPPSEVYLGINTRKLQERRLKEVIGMAFVNQASVYWGRGEYAKTVSLYEKSVPYLPDDPLLNLFLGLNYLFVGKKDEGKNLLKPLRNYTFDYAVSPETLADDYLNKRVDVEGLKAIFLPVDQNRVSILEKQAKLQEILKRCPKFRAGQLQLAVTYLQLARLGDAQAILEKCCELDPEDPTPAYYLSIICLERLDYLKAWQFLERAELITKTRDHHPRALKELRRELRTLCPKKLS